MNEVTKIHLGRDAFTISNEAHSQLKKYLDEINKQIEDKSVVEEVELRMAELLVEHGVSGEKVILPSDVDYLKKQLGNPKDFKEEPDSSPNTEIPADTKRLFRDTDTAMLAGVAAGLSNYFGVDPLIVRLIFILGAFTGGWGIILYIALWILVPEAKTSSERLQMAGKPVTVESLKEVVERADVKAAAHRANKSITGSINNLLKILLKLSGIALIIAGISIVLGLIAAETYFISNDSVLQTYNIFPVGLKEHLLLDIALAITAFMGIFIVLFGLAMFKRRWPIRAWITGTLIGVVLIGIAAGSALAVDVAPTVRDRYNANIHTTYRDVQAFNQVNVYGDAVKINFEPGSTYSVQLKYFGPANASAITTTVSDQTLFINTQNFDWHRNCKTLCIPNSYYMEVTVYSPKLPRVDFPTNSTGEANFEGYPKLRQ